MSLDLNKEYYTVHLDSDSQKLCAIRTQLGKYQCLKLYMGVNKYPVYVPYPVDLIITSNGTFEERLHYLTRMLQQLRRSGDKVNAKKSPFFSLKREREKERKKERKKERERESI